MVRTQIILPSSGVVDLYDDVPVSYNFNSVNIREPEKGIADYTKTIVVPGTKNNHQLFHNQFDLNIDSIYDTRKKLSCVVMVDDVEILTGYIRLMRIIQKGNNDYDYEITIIGETASLFKDIGGDELTVLDISRLDHDYTYSNIINSWYTAAGVGYVYPFMDNGNFPNTNSLYVKHFLPAIYVKEYVDRIFEYYGYSYTSTFFSSNYFKHLIVPFNSELLRYDEAEIATRELRVSRIGSFVTNSDTLNAGDLGAYHTVDFNDDTTPPNINPGSLFNLSTDKYTVAKSGNYYLFTELKYILTTPEEFDWAVWLIIYTPGGQVKGSNVISVDTPSASERTVSVGMNAILDIGDYAMVKTVIQNRSSDFEAGAFTEQINAGSYFKVTVASSLVMEGNVMLMNSAIPEVKISDFLSSLKKLFNLYFSLDPNNSRNYIIEPRDDWYTTTIVDWSDKIDISRDLETVPVGELNTKKYIFRYKEDNDYYNTIYKNKWWEPYGTRNRVTGTDFVKNDYAVEPSFAASPLHSDTSSDRVYTKIRTSTGQAAVGGKLIKTNLRILYYNSPLDCNTWYFNTNSTTVYPYAGHLDHPINPSIDLSYGVPKEVYYQATALGCTYTNNNLYNLYWKNFIDELSDKNSRIVVGYFNLTVLDINQIEPRNLFYFRENLWRLNRIIDYNPTIKGTTKCEFIKVKTSKEGFN